MGANAGGDHDWLFIITATTSPTTAAVTGPSQALFSGPSRPGSAPAFAASAVPGYPVKKPDA
jgi:hypothetical protein